MGRSRRLVKGHWWRVIGIVIIVAIIQGIITQFFSIPAYIAGAGSFAVIKVLETEGVNLPQSEWTPDAISANFAAIGDMSTAKALQGAFEQTQKYVAQAAARAGIKL